MFGRKKQDEDVVLRELIAASLKTKTELIEDGLLNKVTYSTTVTLPSGARLEESGVLHGEGLYEVAEQVEAMREREAQPEKKMSLYTDVGDM